MLSKGQEQVRAALEISRAAVGALSGVAAIAEGWKADVTGRLERVQSNLDGLSGKFFLKSKLCLPFSTKSEQEAGKLEEALKALLAHPDERAQQQFIQALGALERAVKVLQERANMEGMAIT